MDNRTFTLENYKSSGQIYLEYIAPTEGVTDSAHVEAYYYYEWLVCSALSVISSMIALYIMLTQIAFFILKYKTKPGRSPVFHGHSPGRQSSNTSYDDGYMLSIIGTTIVASFAAFLGTGLDITWFYGINSDTGCDIGKAFNASTQITSIASVYIALWLRQRLFYQDRNLKNLTTKCTRIITWLLVVIILASVMSSLGVFIFSVQYMGSSRGCMIVLLSPISKYGWIILLTCNAFYTICFLALFIYPLLQHNRRIKSLKHHRQRENPIIKLIKRAIMTSSGIILTDTLAVLLDVVIENHESVMRFIYKVNVVFNVICLILSFPNWRERLMPWKIKRNYLTRRRRIDIELVDVTRSRTNL